MLASLANILADARANQYAVPAFDCVEDVMVRCVLETAQARRSPVVLMCLPTDLEGNGWTYLPGLVRAVADHHDVPIALHLDHATELGLIERAIECGFTSVMFDGSQLPFAENVRRTKAAVDIAYPHGVAVEAELGHVGGADLDETQHVESVLTEPDEVVRFVEQTGVDALAVSIGTSHGVYRSLPTLNIDRLRELNAVSPVPLVLHGGSGTPDEQIREAVADGICKLNVFTDQREAMFRGLKRSAEQDRPDPLPKQIFDPIREELAALVAEKIELLGSAGRA
jgi:ketose-bisphosphate aldolase